MDQNWACAGKIAAIPIIIAANFRFTARFIDTPATLTSFHFLTTRTDSRLLVALALSLTLHLLPALPELIFAPKMRSTAAPPLSATLRSPPPPAATPEQLPLRLPEQAKPKPKVTPPNKPEPKAGSDTPQTWTQAVRQHLKKLDTLGQFYPPEAIARGQQGDVVVLLIVDAAGNVVAARIEQGSGHPLLDDAALRAVRSLRSLPADAPREALLPVRFRLR